MALSSDTAWEIRTTGSDSNGGGFSLSLAAGTGVDYSQQDSAQYPGGSYSAAGTTTLSDSSNGFTAQILGNIVNLPGQGRYCITAFTDSGHVTVDRALGTFANIGGRVGGAMGSPGATAGVVAANNDVYITGSHTITTATPNVSGGPFNPTVGSNVGKPSRLIGYGTTRGDSGRATIAAGVASINILSANGQDWWFENLILDGNGQTGIRGIDGNGEDSAINVRAYRCTNGGIWGCGSGCLYCDVDTASNASGYDNNSELWFCVVRNQVGGEGGMHLRGGRAFGCAAINGNGSGIIGSFNGKALHCFSYGNPNLGFSNFGTAGNHGFALLINCHAENCGTAYDVGPWSYLRNCGNYNCVGKYSAVPLENYSPIDLTASAFNNPATLDFGLNALAGGGALLRAAGWPSNLPGLAGASFRDIAAYQHQDTGGAGGGLMLPVHFDGGF